MRKKLLIILTLCLALCMAMFVFVACDTEKETKVGSGITFKTLKVDGTTVYGKVSNATETFSFINEVTVSKNAQFIVSLDVYGIHQVATKTISLNEGNNRVYVTEFVNEEPKTVYEVIVRRKPIYNVTFDEKGGTIVENQAVEEDSYATAPATTKVGYSFENWDYDFSKPITEHVSVNAIWRAKTYSFTIVYGNGQPNDIINVEYDTEIESYFDNEPKRLGYAFIGWDGNISANVLAEDFTISALWGELFKISNNSIIDVTDYGKKCTEIEIPSSFKGQQITSIGNDAFYVCNSLIEITIPNTVTAIGNNAFSSCGKLEKVIIPNSVKTIGSYAFSFCRALKKIVLPGCLETITQSAFTWCTSLTSVKITDGVTKIESNAFNGCSALEDIIVPKSVFSIDSCAFNNCDNLKKVYYYGKERDWLDVSIANYNDDLENATRYYYIENRKELPNDDGNYWHYVNGVPTVWIKNEE